jgi:glycosyltransferase involved in cell wall biosynthesis
MHIGVDWQTLRWPEGGLFFFAWNLFTAIKAINTEHQITPLLYGHSRMVEADTVRRFETASPGYPIRYYWEGPKLRLLSHWFKNWKPQPPWTVRQLDRRLFLPFWTRASKSGAYSRFSRSKITLRLKPCPYAGLDLVHHFNYIILPIHTAVNVLTIADLTTLRVPHFHTQGTRDWQQSAYAHAHRMDLIITISEHSKRDVVELLNADESRIRVIPLAAHPQYEPLQDKDAVRQVLEKYSLANRPYILTIATLEPRKNHCRLIEAFHRLRQRAPTLDHALVLVGAKGWLYEPIFETVRRLQLERHVLWLNYVPFEDLPALLNGASLFVYPSLYEGFGLPPLEAMACGTPVIASNTTSLPEVVGDGGLMVNPICVDEIAEAMHSVLTNKELRDRLRLTGLARAKSFSWERTAQMTLSAYEDAWKARQSRPPGPRRLTHVDSEIKKEVRRWVIVKSIEYAKKVVHPIGF